MIIESLFNMIISLFQTLLNWVNISSLPDSLITSVHDTLTNIINFSKGLINLAMPYAIAVILGTIVLVIEGVFLIYSLVMWILRKIPVVSIE